MGDEQTIIRQLSMRVASLEAKLSDNGPADQLHDFEVDDWVIATWLVQAWRDGNLSCSCGFTGSCAACWLWLSAHDVEDQVQWEKDTGGVRHGPPGLDESLVPPWMA